MDPTNHSSSPELDCRSLHFVGSESILDQARILLARIQVGKYGRPLIMIGPRGVKKTGLLNECCEIAQKMGCHTVFIKVEVKTYLRLLIVPQIHSTLVKLSLSPKAGVAVHRGLRVLKSFIRNIEFQNLNLNVELEKGVADAGPTELDLPDLFEAVGEAMQEAHGSLAIFIDELQRLTRRELEALILALHRIQQRRLPLTIVATGGPGLPSHLCYLKPYADRLFNFSYFGGVSADDPTGTSIEQK